MNGNCHQETDAKGKTIGKWAPVICDSEDGSQDVRYTFENELGSDVGFGGLLTVKGFEYLGWGGEWKRVANSRLVGRKLKPCFVSAF